MLAPICNNRSTRTSPSQRGEVALFLSVLAIIASVVGLGIGIASVNQTQTTVSSAQMLPGDYPYRSVLEVRDESNKVVPWIEGMTWSNNYTGTQNAGNIKDANSPDARLTWNTGSVPAHIRNTAGTVTVTIPQGMIAVDTFCTSAPTSICNDSTVSTDGLTRSNIRVQSGGQIVYGVKIRPLGGAGGGGGGGAQPTGTQPTGVQPTGVQPTTPPSGQSGVGNSEVKIVALNYPNRTSLWPGTHATSQQPIACSRDAATLLPLYLNRVTVHATCVAGDCGVGTTHKANNEKGQGYVNFNQMPTGTYRIDSVSDVYGSGYGLYDGCRNQTFTIEKDKITQQAVAMLANETTGTYETRTTEQLCKESGGRPNIIQGIGGNVCYYASGAAGGGGGGGAQPKPTSIGGGSSGLQCNRPCIYSQAVAGGQKCYEGACPADRPDCGGNTPKERIDNGNKGCQFAGSACNLPAREVSCTTGERLSTGQGGGGGRVPTPGPGDDLRGKTNIRLTWQFDNQLTNKNGMYRYRIEVCDAAQRNEAGNPWAANCPSNHIFKFPIDGSYVNFDMSQKSVGTVTRTFQNMFVPPDGMMAVRVTEESRLQGIMSDILRGDEDTYVYDLGPLPRRMDYIVRLDGRKSTNNVDMTIQLRDSGTGGTKVEPTKAPEPTTVSPTTVPDEEFPPKSACEHVRGPAGAPWKFVFLASGYENTPAGLQQFREDAHKAAESLNVTNASHLMDSIQFKLNTDLVTHKDECAENDLCKSVYRPLTSGILLKPRITDSVKACSNDGKFIILRQAEIYGPTGIFGNFLTITANNPFSDYADITRSHGIALLANDNTRSQLDFNLAHELGHLLGHLSDEYITGNRPFRNSNCTIPVSSTCQWSLEGEYGCIAGCSVSTAHRSAQSSIMNARSSDFNPLSLKLLENRVAEKSGIVGIAKSEASDASYYKNSFVIEVNMKNDSVIEDVKIREVYPDAEEARGENSTPEDFYLIKLLSSTGETIYETYAQVGMISSTHGPSLELKQTGFTIYAPYNPAATTVTILSADGTELARADLRSFGIAAPEKTNLAAMCGNAVCDAAIGENANSCRADCGAHLTKSEPERADFVADKVINGQDLAHLMADDTYQVNDGGDINGDGKTDVLDYTIILKWWGYDY